MRLVVLNKAGEAARIAINPDRVTHLRQGPGNFVDVFFGETKIAVAGTFEQVVNQLCGEEVSRSAHDPAREWFAKVQT